MRVLRFRVAWAVAAVCSAAACGGGGSASAKVTFSADAPRASSYDPVDVRLAGLKPGVAVTITSAAVDYRGTRWQGSGQYRADSGGVVDLAKQPSTGGTYTGVDGMGVLWSMNPPSGSLTPEFFPPAGSSFTVSLTADFGRDHAALTLTRVLQSPGVTSKAFTAGADGINGKLFLPAPTSKPRPAVLIFGGSEGGEYLDSRAAMLASAGYPALSLGYWKTPGTPQELRDIPLEYFAKAAALLARQPGVDKEHILVDGASRGTEAALLLAQDFPKLVHGAILIAPSAVANGAYPQKGDAWTLGGGPVATNSRIPVDKVDGPVLALSGGDDQVWGSYVWAPQIMAALDAAHDPFPHKAVTYPKAGHDVGAGPYDPEPDLSDGGTPEGNSAARRASWLEVISLLRSLS